MKIAIIGSGIAAFEAAGTARTLSPEAEIVLYSRERVRPYRRPALSRMASEEVSEVQFYIKPQAFYDENRIRLELGRTLTAFDPDVRQLKFDTGETESYDKLLLATGAHCFLPPCRAWSSTASCRCGNMRISNASAPVSTRASGGSS